MKICCLQDISKPSDRLRSFAKASAFEIVESLADAQRLAVEYYFTDIDGILSLSPIDGSIGGPLFVDFASSQHDYRRHTSGIKQDVAKAVGCKSQYRPSVLDVTAGLGGDAFVLASLMCHVTLLERSIPVYALLEDGVKRASCASDEVSSIVGDYMHLLKRQDALAFLEKNVDQSFDVVYLDPMFPERKKSAKVKKAMQYFHHLVGHDDKQKNASLMMAATKLAKKRVVVKRPKQAPLLTDDIPSYQIKGKSIRYDIYLIPDKSTGPHNDR